ncbi:MAG: hypothetical protein EBR01_03120 [Proteobacteria bacterium]|nr:hypothetical protein [Pseudomonadota bacterium]NBY21101.1 hypothetical protein [bacterium]
MKLLHSLKFLICGLLVLSCGHTPSQITGNKVDTEIPSGAYPKRVIDAHSHFSFDQPDSEQQPRPEMEKAFEEANVFAAVIHLPKDRAKSQKLNIDRKRAKFKMAICAAIVPGEEYQRIEAGLQSGAFQCMKIYLGYIPRWAADPFYLKFYQLAEKYNVPVVFHTGDTYDKKAKVKYAEPLQIDEVALRFPKVNFVIAHMGNPWIQSAAEVVYKNDNVFVDISALMLGDVSKAKPEALEELAIKPIRWFWLFVENPKKMMFGSDWPLMSVRPYVEAVMKAIPKEHWDDVFYKNAAEVFKLDNIEIKGK